MSSYLVSPHAACASVDGGAVLLHMQTKRYYSLNETGAQIWRLLQQRVELAAIVGTLVESYRVGVADAEAALTRLIGELLAESLIVEESR